MTVAGPRELYLEVSNRCQSLCVTCPLTFGGHQSRRDMTLEDVQRIAGQAPSLERVVLHGIGEPLLNPQLPEMVAWFSSRGVRTAFNTNAIALNAVRGRALLEAGLSELRVSVDAATRQSYRRIRGVDALDRVVRHVGAFIAERGPLPPPEVTVSFVAMRENLSELVDVVRLAGRMGADAVNVQRLVYRGEGMAVEEQALYRRLGEEERDLVEEATAVAGDLGVRVTASGATGDAVASLDGRAGMRSACRRPWNSTYVTAHGTVLACCIAPFTGVPFADLVLGDLRTDSLADVWRGERYERVRSGLLGDRPEPFCEGCGERWSV